MHLSTTSILTYLTALLTLTLGAGSALIAEHDGALVLATSVLPIIATTEQDVATALFCTGPNFSGDCHHCALGVHDCGTFLPNFPVVGSFRPDVGFACTLYGVNPCQRPLLTASAKRGGLADLGSMRGGVPGVECYGEV